MAWPEALAAEPGAGGGRLCLTATPAASVLIHWQGKSAILRREGVLARSAGGPVCHSSERSAKNREKAILPW